MAKNKIIKIIAMAFAIALLMAFVVPSTAAMAVDNPPALGDVLSSYPKQQFVLAFDLVTGDTGYEYEAITIPLTYNALEYLEVPVLTSDGSFTVNVTWFLDSEYDLVFDIDLSQIAQYYGVQNYRLYSLSPGIFLKGDSLVTVACDSFETRYDCYYDFFVPEMYISSDHINYEDFASLEWDLNSNVLTHITEEEWETRTFTLPDVWGGHDAFFVTGLQVDIECSISPTELQIGVPLFDAEHEQVYFYQGVFDDYWSPQHRFHNPPVYIEGSPDVTKWMADLFGNILSMELFPGITFGGLLFCFIAIPVALIFLRLFAGG